MSKGSKAAQIVLKILFFIFSNLPFIVAGTVVFIIGIKIMIIDGANLLFWLGAAVVSALIGYAILRFIHKSAGQVTVRTAPWVLLKFIEVVCIGGVYFLLTQNLAASFGELPKYIIAGIVAIAGYILWERRFNDGAVRTKPK